MLNSITTTKGYGGGGEGSGGGGGREVLNSNYEKHQ